MTTTSRHLSRLDGWLLDIAPQADLHGVPRFLVEFLFFGLKQARACLFAGLFFLAIFITPRTGVMGIPRYDLLLVIALAIQMAMIGLRLETVTEFKAICLFHIVGFALEVFKTSASIQSWAYPDFAWTKLMGVPLFAGFMYAAIGSYIIQAWRLLDIRIQHHPPYWMAALLALAIYANFFTHHYIGDYRWYIAAVAIGLYARATVLFRAYDRDRKMPFILSFILIGFFVWLAENISTFFSVWRYPNQIGIWSIVHLGKWSSWTLMVIMTFTIVASLKHIRATIHIAK
ncbi:DUF817 domain-containing protein [Martelella sp. HB161492]|uniref:DUF817 domain-containing protein n=1 Tax=Martelella sp. HB161492 TaxID=2720726 RepID=UPI0015917FE9|nr:DUF817 domain-containing protein [Martelella sp. HB161492]